jgi:hypothetical protein
VVLVRHVPPTAEAPMTNEDNKRLEAFEDQLVDMIHMLYQQPTGETRDLLIINLSKARIGIQVHREHG